MRWPALLLAFSIFIAACGGPPEERADCTPAYVEIAHGETIELQVSATFQADRDIETRPLPILGFAVVVAEEVTTGQPADVDILLIDIPQPDAADPAQKGFRFTSTAVDPPERTVEVVVIFVARVFDPQRGTTDNHYGIEARCTVYIQHSGLPTIGQTEAPPVTDTSLTLASPSPTPSPSPVPSSSLAPSPTSVITDAATGETTYLVDQDADGKAEPTGDSTRPAPSSRTGRPGRTQAASSASSPANPLIPSPDS